MNEPWSSFREVVFDIIAIRDDWSYIGYGRLAKFKVVPSQSQLYFPLSQSTNLALNEMG